MVHKTSLCEHVENDSANNENDSVMKMIVQTMFVCKIKNSQLCSIMFLPLICKGVYLFFEEIVLFFYNVNNIICYFAQNSTYLFIIQYSQNYNSLLTKCIFYLLLTYIILYLIKFKDCIVLIVFLAMIFLYLFFACLTNFVIILHYC